MVDGGGRASTALRPVSLDIGEDAWTKSTDAVP